MVSRFLVTLLLLAVTSPAYAHSWSTLGGDDYASMSHNTRFHTAPLGIFLDFEIDTLPSSLGSEQVLVSKRDSSGYAYQIAIGTDDRIYWRVNSGTYSVVSDNVVTADNQTRIFVYIDSSFNMGMWVDDTEQADTDVGAAFTTVSPAEFYVGAQEPSTKPAYATFYSLKVFQGEIFLINIPRVMQYGFVEEGLVGAYSFQDVHVLPDETDNYNSFKVWDARSTYISDGYKATNRGGDNQLTINDGQWNIDTINFVIEDQYADRYWPGPLTGTMNIGVSRETPVDPNDHSWRVMPQRERDQFCTNAEYHIDDDATCGTGDGSLGSPFCSIDEALSTSRKRTGNCFFLHAGTYFDSYTRIGPTFYDRYDNVVSQNEGYGDEMMWFSGWTDGEAIIRGDHTNDLTWQVYDANIYKTSTTPIHIFRGIGGVVLDECWPYCTYEQYDIADVQIDGDWYRDTQTGTATGTATNKLIDSTANFGAETLPVEVGMYVKQGTQAVQITAIDSTTQLTLAGDIVTSGESYTIIKYLYVHTSGTDPTDRNIVVVEGNDGNSSVIFDYVASSFIGIWGLTFEGAGSYPLFTFKNERRQNMALHVINSTFKYNFEGVMVGLPNANKVWRNRIHGNTIHNIGMNHAGGYYWGTAGGWPSAVGHSTTAIKGCIISHSGGESIGGAGKNGIKYANPEGAIIEDNIIWNGWSVGIYPDVRISQIVRRNLVFMNIWMPYEIAPEAEIGNGASYHSVVNRLWHDGIIAGDETAETWAWHLANASNPLSNRNRDTDLAGSHWSVYNNVVVGLRTGWSYNYGGRKLSTDDPFTGNRWNNIVNNVFIGHNWDARSVRNGCVGIFQGKDESASAHIGSHALNNVILQPGLNCSALHLRLSDKDMWDSDYNLFIVNEHKTEPFEWRPSGYGSTDLLSFSDYKTASGQDANSALSTIDEDGNLTASVFKKSNWSLRGDFSFKFTDLEPAENSLLINTGTNALDTDGTFGFDFRRDFDKKQRPLGTSQDKGLYENGNWYEDQLRGAVNFKGGVIK